ncbi:substrate-binding domain-containing protein [Seonamhaeicola marinus]|uniref:Substrate-binding domain-containing protein n=1 Tax=Seonamhaeicola marinus TaxID=1912246 RepID=A0A5D0IMY8_9FLAO|nr:substrate-binding domain-containing protein [Seonamhaeicola marinus]TYA84399.1 substrate-binding domain-containing protein [Seonamhaeicola marinus]
MTTIKDIAKKANVSTGTVDRVIHNRPGVSKKTKAHIEKIIKEHNFQINTIASTLALNKSYKIGVLIPEASSENEFWSEPKKGIEKATEDIKNFRVSTSFFLFNQFDSQSYTTAFSNILEGEFDAVLIAPVFQKETSQLTQALDKKNIPYVFINIQINSLNAISFIGQDSFKSGYLGAKLMSVMIADTDEVLVPVFRLNTDNNAGIYERINGFKSYFEEKRPSVKISNTVIPDVNNFEVIKSSLDKEFEKTNIAGIFVPSSSTYLISKYLESSNIKNIRLIGYDTNQENLQYLKKDIIDFLICQNPYLQGFNGIKLLSDYLVMNKMPEGKYHSAITIVTRENMEAY